MLDLTKMSVEELLQEVENNGSNGGDGRGHYDPELVYRVAAELTRRTEVPKGHVKLDDGRVVKVRECSTNPLNGLMYITAEAALAERKDE